MPNGDARGRLLLAAIIAPILLLGIFDHELWTPDEPRAAELSREFLEPGHSWAVPTLNREPFLEKPPLVYWTSAVSMRLFGVSAWAARLPCVLFGIGMLVFTGLLGRALFGEEIGRGALMILATTSGFLLVSHHLESDSGLACFTTGAAYFLHRALTKSPRWHFAFHSCLLGGFFSKGLIAIVFLGLLFVSWIVWNRSWKDFLSPPLLLGIPVLVAPIALWLYRISLDPRGHLVRVFLIDNHLGRFLGGGAVHLGHENPFYYYAIQLPAQFAPWIAAFLILLPRFRGRLREPRLRFLLCWLIPGLLFLSIASTKRGIYAIPLLPPLAILTAQGMVNADWGRWIPRITGGLATLFVVAALIVIPKVEPRKTLRPFAEAVNSYALAGRRIVALNPDETTLAVIPFYSQLPLESALLADVEALARRGEPMALVVGPHPSRSEEETVKRYFPDLVWASPENHSRRMWIYANRR